MLDTELSDTNHRILLVDDEPAFLRLCSGWLAGLGYHVSTAKETDKASQYYENENFDLVLVDLAMPPSMDPQEGLRLISRFDRTPVIVLTGHAHRELALQAIEMGAWDFLAKPLDPAMLGVVVERALEKQSLVLENRRLQKELNNQRLDDNFGIIGISKPMEQLRNLIGRIGPSEINVIISGASGTGKELVARAIHRYSKRADAPFVPVNCGAISDNLFESEFFGHLKGSFTGATADRPGLIASADGGTLFLDEIGDMPLAMQVKLLRFLQEGNFLPVGSDTPASADIRVITATHRDLQSLMESQKFREDLYYRIKGVEIKVPSLSDRIEDIPLLANHFLQQDGNTSGNEFDTDAIDWLLEQPWNGNVRELENCIESAVALCGEGSRITRSHLMLEIGEVNPPTIKPETLNGQLAELEKRLIIGALDRHQQNRSQAAISLGISRVGLLKKMARLGLR